MKKLDYIIQVCYYAFAFGCLMMGDGAFFTAMIGHFFLGIWQVLSSIITGGVFYKRMSSELKKHYLTYWKLTALYFVVMYFGNLLIGTYDYSENFKIVGIIYMFGVSTILAIYYTWITYNTVNWQQFLKNRSFLNTI